MAMAGKPTTGAGASRPQEVDVPSDEILTEPAKGPASAAPKRPDGLATMPSQLATLREDAGRDD